MSASDRKVAFVGLGEMGGQLAKRIAARRVALAVGDVSEKARESFRGLARLAESPADAARGVATAHVCVRDDAQVESVVFGRDGLVAGLDAREDRGGGDGDAEHDRLAEEKGGEGRAGDRADRADLAEIDRAGDRLEA